MGHSDRFISSCLYKPYVSENVDLKNVKSIAWLGWTNENILMKDIIDECSSLEKSDLYDIKTDLGATYWDINEDWDISGYDLVVCLRTTVFVEDKEHFLRNLKKLINNNGKAIFDFILPPVTYASQFSISERKLLEREMGVEDKTDYFFTWYNVVIKTEVGYMKESDHLIGHSGVDIPSKSIIARSALEDKEHNSGHCFLPCFDDIIYPDWYKKMVGVNFDKEKVQFIAEEERKMLYEGDFYRHKIDNLIRSIGFRYFLNYIPTFKLREKICTTLFTFQK